MEQGVGVKLSLVVVNVTNTKSLNFIRLIVTTPFFSYKKTVYKNIQAEIPEKMRTSTRTSQPHIMEK